MNYLAFTNFFSGEGPDQTPLPIIPEEELVEINVNQYKEDISELESKLSSMQPNLSVLREYHQKEQDLSYRQKELDECTGERDKYKDLYDDLRKQRHKEFMEGFNSISDKLKEMYRMITLGGNAELELVDSLDPFSEGIIFSVMPPKKSWKNISNLSGGEKVNTFIHLIPITNLF